MAGKDDTEEKSLPPSKIKLDRLRREGQVPRSKDLPVAISVIAIFMWLSWSFGSLGDDIVRLFDIALRKLDAQASGGPALRAGEKEIMEAAGLFLGMIWPPLVIGVVAVILTSVINAKGLPMAAKNMRFDLNRLNPAEGVKKIFGLASISEFIKNLVKIVLLIAVGSGALIYFLNGIFWAPLCGGLCSLYVAAHFIGTLGFISAMILLIAALADIRISGALFRHEHRMTKSEAKREHKDSEGDPYMRSARNRIAQEMRSEPPPRKQGPS